MSLANRIARLRYGQSIIVVSGLPRSGTSMAMNMLGAGGIPLVTDGVRTADASNPQGYFELERVRTLHTGGDTAWLAEARGRAIKIVSFLLTWLPDTYSYKVVFMERDLGEVIASEGAMLLERGEAPDLFREAHTRLVYQQHLEQVHRFLSRRRCFETLTVGYEAVLDRPREEADRMSRFLGGRLNVESMTAVVDPALYRARRG